jgi:hypothetical protein
MFTHSIAETLAKTQMRALIGVADGRKRDIVISHHFRFTVAVQSSIR